MSPNSHGTLEYCYFPGCTLKTRAKNLDYYARLAAEALDVRLEELKDWQCCGAVYPLAKDEIATRLSSVRALDTAKQRGQDLLTLCSACHHVIKRVNDDMRREDDIRMKVNNYLQLDNEYVGESRVLHYLEMLRDDIGFEKVKEKVTCPLKGKKIAAYYGCLLLRPSSVMAMDNPENPTIMEDFISAIGAKPVIYPQRNECCGGYITLENRELAEKMCKRIIDSAKEKGAEAIITACPLCLYNLKINGGGQIPIYYFTELLAYSLGVSEMRGAVNFAG